MSFLYPAFLAGAVAIALPIVLHLLRRDVAPEVPFTAVHLLRKSPVERSKRRRLRDLILLAVRVVALLLLATAFARPYRANAATGAPLVIVAVDRSYSMTAPGRFARATELVREAIDGAGGSRVALLAFDERADQLTAPGSASEARNALKNIEPGFAGTRYAPVVARAAEAADGGAARLVIVTDLQRAGWEDEQPVAMPASLTVEIKDTGAPSGNVALVRARVERGTVVASIRNASTAPYAAPVHVALDGREVATAPVSVAPGATTDVVVPYQPPQTGTLTVSIDDSQGFAADNARYVLLDRAPRRRVLIIGSGTPPNLSGFYLSRALATAAAADDGLDADVVPGSTLLGTKVEDLSKNAAVVLLTTRGFDRRVHDAFAGYLTHGGGVLIAAGPEVDPSVLAGILDWREPPRTVDRQEKPLALSATDLRHPIFRPFGGLAANLGQVRFDRLWRVDPAGWNVAARFTDGTPALLERSSGPGRLALFASDVDRRWNDFPLHPAFVPFAIESVRYVVGGDRAGREYTVSQAPAGTQPRPGVYRIPPDNRAVVVNVDTRESGTTRMTENEFQAMLQRVEVPPAAAVNVRAQQTEARQNYWRYGLVLMLAALVAESFVGKA